MAKLQITYKGVLLAQVPVNIDQKGHCVKATLAGFADENVQICHMWKTTKNGFLDRGGSSLDSTTDGTLEIRIVPDDANELARGDFIVLEHVSIYLMESE